MNDDIDQDNDEFYKANIKSKPLKSLLDTIDFCQDGYYHDIVMVTIAELKRRFEILEPFIFCSNKCMKPLRGECTCGVEQVRKLIKI